MKEIKQFTKINVPPEWVNLWGFEAWRDEHFSKNVQKGGSMNTRINIEKRFKFKPNELSGSFSAI